ncbi:hypothetical protein Pla110_11790 [Polystyrenella longa]|uniref:Lipoprotein n=1 Tax=Polystyrenella longa TaxID=2528007 RepID=A0A518CJQ8_9PLAN|nr:hypothetical protein [Polystyrenella longa]QDU79469.1 hypothetical protein Pla110_11790 [Polystyrenella longa]
MSKLILKLMVSVGLISWLVGCSSMTGGSTYTSMSPASLNPLSGIGKTFSGHSEPPVEADMDFVERDVNEKSAMLDPVEEESDESLEFTDDELDFSE